MTQTFKQKIRQISLFALMALFLVGLLGRFSPIEASTTPAQNSEHTHCICGGERQVGDHTACTDTVFQPYSGGDVTYDASGAAYLYLESDVLLSPSANNCTDGDGIFMVKNGQTLYLCLNGHSFQNGNRTSNVIDVYAGGKLVLCDCRETGWIGGRQSGANSGSVWVAGIFEMYGGSLKNNRGLKNGGGLYLDCSGIATLYGGSICNNSVCADGGGVFARYGATFTMYGGTISNNRATDTGGGVYIHYKDTVANFTMYDGIIENNQSGSAGGGVYVSGAFTMNGGSIKKNSSARHGGGIAVKWDMATMTLNGGTVENNLAYGGGGGIFAASGATLNVNGGVVQNNESHFEGGGIFLYGLDGYGNGSSVKDRLKFNMTGGTVTKNKAGGLGGGIYFYEYTDFTFNATEHDIIIADNEDSNLYLVDNKNYTLNITSLTEGSRIGISAMRNPWILSGANTTDYSPLFHADSNDAMVVYNPTDNKLTLISEFTKLTLRYDLNGGEGAIADGIGKTLTGSDNVTVTDTIPTRICHNFLGWADTPNATSATYHAGDTVTLTGDQTLYAVWEVSHVLTQTNQVTPDCTHDGKREYWSCGCGKYYSDASGTTEIADLETWGILPAYHSALTKTDRIEPDCTHDGKLEFWSCSHCGKNYADQAGTTEIQNPSTWGILTAHHTLTKVEKVAADCTNSGKREHWSCSVCGKHFEDPAAEQEIADFASWGILPVQHTFTAWIAEVPATADSEGTKAHKDCSVCHKHFDADDSERTDDELRIAKLSVPDTPAVPNEPDPAIPTPEVLPSAAVAGIAVGSTVAVETGGFSLLWFAIKKKKWSDFVAVFAKK